MTTIRQNTDLKHILIKHTLTAAGTRGLAINASAITHGLVGAQYDILVNSDGTYDLTPVWTFAADALAYQQNVALYAITKYVMHHPINTIDSDAYRNTSIHVGVVGNFDDAAPSIAQTAAVKRLLDYLLANFDINSVLYHSDIVLTSSPGRFFPKKQLFNIKTFSDPVFLSPITPTKDIRAQFKIKS